MRGTRTPERREGTVGAPPPDDGAAASVTGVAADPGAPLRSTAARMPAIAAWLTPVTAALGLLVVALADNHARTGAGDARPLFWCGVLLIVIPIAAVLLGGRHGDGEAVWQVALLAVALYVVKLLGSPLAFTFHDELGHWRTLDDLMRTGHLFHHNPILRASPFYPGLETVTSAFADLSGLSRFGAGVVVIGVARLLGLVAVYLLYRAASGSVRVAGVATVVYATNPTFLFFDGQFSYESLAIGLAPVVLLALARLRPSGGIPIAILVAAGVVATHHLTSYALCGVLVLWLVVSMVARRRPGDASTAAIAAVAAAAIAMAVLWAELLAPVTSSYIIPVLKSAGSALLSLAQGSGGVKHPFQGTGGYGRPAWERYTSFLSVLLVAVGLLVGLVVMWRRRIGGALGWTLAVVGLLYPLTLLPRLTQAGTEVANRSSGFVFVGAGLLVGFALAAAVEARRSGGRLAASASAAMACVAVLVVGGIDIGWPPFALLPGPYLPAANSRSVDTQSQWAAEWARSHLQPGQRVFADFDLALLMSAYGHQDPQGGHISGVAVPRLFTSRRFTRTDLRILRADNLRYLAVDRRLSDALPAAGYYFAPTEPGAFHHFHAIPREALTKFERVRRLDEVFRNGAISIYDAAPLLPAGR